MRIRRSWQMAAFASLAILAAGARAASVSYLLDQSNADPLVADGQPYVSVTVADGPAGAIGFTVSVLPSLTGIASNNFGLKSFAFSSRGAAEVLLLSHIVGLPAGWSISFGSSGGDFGIFDVVLARGPSAAPLSPQLAFSITGVSSDSIADYLVLSHGRAAEGRADYAARVAGFLDQDPGRRQLTTAWFGGSRLVTGTNIVPLPGAAWLLASAISWLAAARRRRGPPAI